MSEARINRISNEKGDGGPSLSGITTFSGLNYFVPPKGTTAERPSDCPPGSIRFNTDSAHLEYWDGLQWLEFEATNDELGIANNAAGTSGGLGHRGMIAGGYNESNTIDDIEYVTISTLGNGQYFGDLTLGLRRDMGSASSSTRAVFAGGANVDGVAGQTANIEFVTFSSTGNSTDFGADLTIAKRNIGSSSNSTRALFAGGYTSSPTSSDFASIDYITMASTGVAAQDFGDLHREHRDANSVSSSTRALFAGGTSVPSNVQTNTIDYVTISTLGDAQDFGDLISGGATTGVTPVGNSTRGIFAGALLSSTLSNVIQFVTIASTGNSQDFGDLIETRMNGGGCSSPTRGVIYSGGDNGGSSRRGIEYITISTTGDGIDFGDTFTSGGLGLLGNGCSNGHGGL